MERSDRIQAGAEWDAPAACAAPDSFDSTNDFQSRKRLLFAPNEAAHLWPLWSPHYSSCPVQIA